MSKKTVLITGATSGIGKSTAYRLADSKMKLIICGRRREVLDKIREDLSKLTSIITLCFDVSDNNQVKKAIESVPDEFKKIDILINNAGITKDNLLMRMSEEDFDHVINNNLKSVFNMSSAIQRTFLKQRKGSIINIGSIVGLKGNPGQSNYAASKAGVIGFTKSLALELGSRNIRVNVIAPGFIETEMTQVLPENIIENWKNNIPLKRIGKSEDVANACIFLASELSDYITGQVIQVDGGMLT